MPDEHIHCRTNIEPDIKRLLKAVDPEPVWQEQGNRKVSRMVRFLRRSGDPIEGEAPVSRSGGRGFAGRFTYEVIDGGKTLRYGNASISARLLYLGGVVRPVTAKYLTIPVDKRARNTRAKDWPDAFVVGEFGKRMFLAIEDKTKSGKTKGLVLLFQLLKSVTIKPHPWGIEWDQVDNDALRASLQRRVEAAEKGH